MTPPKKDPGISSRDIAERSIGELRLQYHVDGLDALISELKALKKSGIYEKFFDAYKNWEEPAERSNDKGEIESPLLNLAYENLDPHSGSMVDYFNFCWLYPFLELFYSRDIGRNLYLKDLEVLYSSRIDERVVLAFDRFDEVDPEPVPDFFYKLSSVEWESRKTKQFFEKLKKIRHFLRYEIVGYLEDVAFQDGEDAFILLVTCCSAATQGRNINDQDVVRAFMTYFKLLKTDISLLVNRLMEENSHKTGYLVCERCNGYYKLGPGESPDDFSLCQCHGKLSYYESINWLLNGNKVD
jgi:hypothetical protein